MHLSLLIYFFNIKHLAFLEHEDLPLYCSVVPDFRDCWYDNNKVTCAKVTSNIDEMFCFTEPAPVLDALVADEGLYEAHGCGCSGEGCHCDHGHSHSHGGCSGGCCGGCR